MTHKLSWELQPAIDFKHYHKAWNQLNTTLSALLDARFMQALIDNFSSGNEKIATAKINGIVVIITIIEKVGFGKWQTFQPSQAPIGAWIQAPEINQSHAIQHLCKKLDGITLTFGVTQQDPEILKRPSESAKMNSLDYIQTACVSVNSSFDEYWAKRGKNLRQNLRRQRNRLERENIAISLNKITQPNQIYDAVEQYGQLESASWKSTEGTSVHIENQQGKFYTQLLEAFCETNETLIYQYKYDGLLVATDLCISKNGVIIILKTTFDETIKTSSPAMLMRQDAFQQIFDKKTYQKIEFYGKVMNWHTKWTSEMRTMYHITYYPFSLIKWLKKNR